jgi:hypothetical protein
MYGLAGCVTFWFRMTPTVFRLILDTPRLSELSVAEQRYQAVLGVIGNGLSISQVGRTDVAAGEVFDFGVEGLVAAHVLDEQGRRWIR